jgi:hypothetical protein
VTQTPRTSSPLQLVAKNVGGGACSSRGMDCLEEGDDEAEAEEGGGQQVLEPAHKVLSKSSALLDLLQYFICICMHIYMGRWGV